MIVLDASFLVKLVVEEEGSEQAERLVLKWLSRGEKLTTIDIALAEAANALWKHYSIHRDLGLEEFKEAIKDLQLLWNKITHHPTSQLLPQAVEEAVSLNITVYDALYLSAAIRENAVLATFDSKLAEKAREKGLQVAP